MALKLIGAPRDQVVGAECHKFICPAERGRCPVSDLGQTVDNSERVLLTVAGHRCAIIKTVVPVVIGGRKHLLESFVDITARKEADEQLRANRQLLRTTLDSLRDAVFVISLEDSQIIDCNPAATEVFGYAREEMVGRNVLLLHVDEDSCWEFRRALQAALAQKGYLQQFEFWMRRKDGTIISTSHTVAPLLDNQGHRTGWVSLVQDITERKRAEEQLALFKHSTDVHYDGVYWTDSDNRLIYVNDSSCKGLGYTREEMIGKPIGEVIPGESSDVLNNLWVSLRSRGFFTLETVHRRKDGTEFPVDLVITYVQFGGKEFACGRARDITERKRAEKALRESEQFNREVIANAQEGVVVYDRELRYQVWNRFMEELTGVPASQALGQHALDLFPFLREQNLDLMIRRALGCEVVHAPDTQFHVPSTGRSGWVSIVYSPHYDANGEIQGVIGIVADITARKRTEEALRSSEAEFRTAFNASPEPMAIRTFPEGRFMEVNHAFVKAWGYSREETLGRASPSLGLFVNPEDFHRMNELIQKDGKFRDLEVKMRRKSGGIAFTLFAAERIELNGRSCVLSVARDITERRRAEEALRESEAGLAAAQRIAHIGSWFWNVQTDTARWSDETFRILGMTPCELTNHRQIFLNLVHPADRIRVDRALNDALNGTREYDIDFRIERPDGAEKVIHAQAEVLLDDLGRPLAMRGTNHDITEHLRAEAALRESEERFRSLFENATVGIYRTTPDGKILAANPTLVKMVGYHSLDELLKRNLEEDGFEPTYPRRLFRERMEREGEVKGLEAVWAKPDGSAIFVRESARAIRGEDNEILYYDGIVEDITERRRAEEKLQESEERFRQLAENVEEVLLLFDPQMNQVFYVSPAYEKVWGRSCESLYREPPFVPGRHPSR